MSTFPKEFINVCTFSSLRRLDLSIPDDRISFLTPFIRRSGHNLESARIAGLYSLNDEELIGFLEHMPTLQRLELNDIDVRDGFFAHLGRTACNSETHAPNFLPNLQSFILACYHTFEWSSLHHLKMYETSPLTKRRPLKSVDITRIDNPEEPEESESVDSNWDCDSEAFNGPELIEPEDLRKVLEVIESGVDLKLRNNSDVDLIEESRRYYAVRRYYESNTRAF